MELFIFAVWIGGTIDAFMDLRKETKYSPVPCLVTAALWPVWLGFYMWRKIKPLDQFKDMRAEKDKQS